MKLFVFSDFAKITNHSSGKPWSRSRFNCVKCGHRITSSKRSLEAAKLRQHYKRRHLYTFRKEITSTGRNTRGCKFYYTTMESNEESERELKQTEHQLRLLVGGCDIRRDKGIKMFVYGRSWYAYRGLPPVPNASSVFIVPSNLDPEDSDIRRILQEFFDSVGHWGSNDWPLALSKSVLETFRIIQLGKVSVETRDRINDYEKQAALLERICQAYVSNDHKPFVE